MLRCLVRLNYEGCWAGIRCQPSRLMGTEAVENLERKKVALLETCLEYRAGVVKRGDVPSAASCCRHGNIAIGSSCLL